MTVSVVVAVARTSRLIVGAWVTPVVDWVGTPLFADTLPLARRFCTDGATVYPVIVWPEPETHVRSVNKDETDTIEGVNANLRTDRGRLKRRGRCFSRSAEKLTEAVRLFVWHDNRRRRLINAQPQVRHSLPLLF